MPRPERTPRYVQMLFETEDTTFSAFVLGQRLACAYRMLIDPRLADWTISAVAFNAGFEDLSYFNRTFRRHFAATPSELRTAARNISAQASTAPSTRSSPHLLSRMRIATMKKFVSDLPGSVDSNFNVTQVVRRSPHGRDGSGVRNSQA